MNQEKQTAVGYCELREKLLLRWGQLQSERASWRPHWQELSNYLLPRSGRFFSADRNRGESRYNAIYDNTATRALRILGAGLMAGATSPARPWFKLQTPDEELNNYRAVKVWLEEVSRLISRVFAKSNTYQILHMMYEELAVFGTAVSLVMPDFENIIHHHFITTGRYALAADANGKVDTMYREFEMTVAQMVKYFGYDKCSLGVRNMFDNRSLDVWVKVVHAIEPREDRDRGNPTSKHMPWGSWYFEHGNDSTTFLRESGFEYFPVLAPRWSVSGGDIYGNSPGMEALGDTKQLQHEQLRKAQGIDYQTRPPLQVPANLKNREIDTLPGGITYVDANGPAMSIRSIYEVNLDLHHLLADIQDCRGRIQQAFYADLFLLLSSATDTRMTATEVAERHEEKLLMLGPVLGRMNTELLEPLIELTFRRLLSAGVLPPPPPELEGVNLGVEFVSILAQAQRSVGVAAVDRWLGNVGAVAQYSPDVLDKINTDYWCEAYADMLGVDPKLLRDDTEVAAIRQQRAKQQQQAQEAAMAEQQSKVALNEAKAAAEAPDNRSTNIMDQLIGYNTPGVMPS